MKIRNGFVSNSSSSSFIVIDKTDKTPIDQVTIDNIGLKLKATGDVVKFPLKFGQNEFGWEFEKYTDWYDKLNFAFIQAIEMATCNVKYQNKKYFELFKQYVNELFGIKITYKKEKNGMLRMDFNEGYIDHQSMGYDQPENLEMFNSLEDFKQFIFNDNSFIHTGNDQEIDEDDEDYMVN